MLFIIFDIHIKYYTISHPKYIKKNFTSVLLVYINYLKYLYHFWMLKIFVERIILISGIVKKKKNYDDEKGLLLRL